MHNDLIIQKTAEHIKNLFMDESSGHDWWHIYRVWNVAKYIAAKEKADLFVVELTALLHDVADWKMHGGDLEIGPKVAREWLETLHVKPSQIDKICNIILNMSFKGAGVDSNMDSIEGMIVQDADRLDAIGAIGIARAFTFGGHIGQLIYDPMLEPKYHTSFDEYKNKKTTAVNHFYEKLLLLKEKMNTQTAKHLAKERHDFMEKFLNQFLLEWNMNN